MLLPPGVILISCLNPDGYYEILPGQTLVFEIDVFTGNRFELKLFQSGHSGIPQDWSVEATFTETPVGPLMMDLSLSTRCWHLAKYLDRITYIYDKLSISSPPGIIYRIPIDPGNYYLNVANKENKTNFIYYNLCLCDCPPLNPPPNCP